MKETESVIERSLCRLVAQAGGMCLKFASNTECGYPDRLILLPGGRALWCELKSTGKAPRKLQELRHARLRELGFEVGVCDSRASVAEFVKRITNEL